MIFSYKKLWILLLNRDIKRRELCTLAGISSATLAKMSKGKSVTTDSLLKICIALQCDISDIMEITDTISFEEGHQKE
ncbi:MAG: helix-turn-helix transcriptional regulator [Clostridia bacterium]|nr:helix-turn-helix transcriptional regulator [Clostridia bacterium]